MSHRSLKTHVDDVIAGALALVADPVDDELAASGVDHEAMPEAAWNLAMEARVDAYIADRSDALLRLRSILGGVGAVNGLLQTEIDRLNRRRERLQRLWEYVTGRTMAVLQTERLATGGSEGERHKVELADSYVAIRVTRSQRVEIDDLDELPRSLVRTVVQPDKTQIRARLKAGAVVPGARLAESVTESVEWGR